MNDQPNATSFRSRTHRSKGRFRSTPRTRTQRFRRSSRWLPPAGAPNVLVVLLDDVGFAASSAFGGPCATPTAERLAGERPEVQPLSYDRALRAHARSAAQRAQSPHGRDGRHHRARDLGARLQLAAPQHLRAAGRDAEAERLLDGAVRQVPRGAGLADEPDGPVRRMADRRRRLRVLLRLHRR